jgi:hypothetical protein
MTFRCFCGREYVHLPDLLDHHFHEHEKEIPKESLERIRINPTTIGFVNTKVWVNVLGQKID